MVIGNVQLDLDKVKIPIYNLATREDHIAPAKSVFLGSKFFGGPVRFVLVRLRPYRRRGQSAGQAESISTGPAASRRGADVEAWLTKANEHPGSWWPDWLALDQGARRRTQVPAREPGGGKLKPIEDAPGSYVKVRD